MANPFSSGTTLATVVYPAPLGEKIHVFIGILDYELDRAGNRIFAWHNARIRAAGSDLPERIASVEELWQIARFLDNRGVVNTTRQGLAMQQLKAYVLFASAAVKNESRAALLSAA